MAQLERNTVIDNESDSDLNQQANVHCYSPLQDDIKQFLNHNLTTILENVNNETDPFTSASVEVDSKLTQTDEVENSLTSKNETVIEMKNASTSDTIIRTGLRPVIIDGSNVAFR